MTERPTIRCTNCGKLNRIGSSSSGVPRCAVCHHPLPWVIDADRETFDQELQASVPVLVDFWAPWCGPCRMVSPALERLAGEQAGKLKLVKVNTDEEEALGSRFGIRGIPTMILFEGGRERDRVTGALPLNDLRRWLEERLTTQGTRSKG